MKVGAYQPRQFPPDDPNVIAWQAIRLYHCVGLKLNPTEEDVTDLKMYAADMEILKTIKRKGRVEELYNYFIIHIDNP